MLNQCDNDFTYLKESNASNFPNHNSPCVNQGRDHSHSSVAPSTIFNDTDNTLSTNHTNDTLLDLSLPTGSDSLQDALSTALVQRSTRISKTLNHFKDYVCNMTSHWCNLVSNASCAHKEGYSTQHWEEPKFYKDAITDPAWVEAMYKELTALEKNNTWISLIYEKARN